MRNKIIAALFDADELSSADLFLLFKEQITQETAAQFREFYLTPLRIEGFLVSLACDKWGLSDKGFEEVRRARLEAVPVKPGFVGVPAAPRRVVIPTHLYQGKELGKTCTRPGAYDAYAIPSLILNKRMAPRHIKD